MKTKHPLGNPEEDSVKHPAIHDVNERKRETQLKLFRTLVDQSNDSFIVADPETARLLDVNEQGCRGRGYSREEFLALRVFDIDPMVGPDEFSKVVAELRAKGELIWQGLHRRKEDRKSTRLNSSH